jgi:hypothetical protein
VSWHGVASLGMAWHIEFFPDLPKSLTFGQEKVSKWFSTYFSFVSLFISPWLLETIAREVNCGMGLWQGGGHGLPKVSLGPAMP